MKKLAPFFISCLLLVGAAACNDASKTAQSAPDNVNQNPASPAAETTQEAKQDAQSEVRRRQLNQDIRANEQRNNVTGGDTDRDKGDLATEVRSKLEANIPDGQLTVAADDKGTVTVNGTVNNQDQYNKIQPLAKEIKGVKNVVNKAVVAPAKQ
ncbi:BON domain-containing protein [Nostoc sp. FACHB-152]|uniref:BON domain-containing protein n=1 Tax=unclassified Nostoc TaxID=2593658 RepID=UPI0016895C7C|nr:MULTISPECIES: BON domain-containing protein [unclassified Nostoc]MBD2449562.1 BON domain-containing protein [Nostoc sp. FACHB-152]MBD2470889.1 BON domain-containing protein [Nostoc sp. FACHB-145]